MLHFNSFNWWSTTYHPPTRIILHLVWLLSNSITLISFSFIRAALNTLWAALYFFNEAFLLISSPDSWCFHFRHVLLLHINNAWGLLVIGGEAVRNTASMATLRHIARSHCSFVVSPGSKARCFTRAAVDSNSADTPATQSAGAWQSARRSMRSPG